MNSMVTREHGLDVHEQLPEFVREGWTGDEVLLRACVASGVVGDFSFRASKTRLSGEVIRQVLLECAYDGAYRQRGVEVRGATIVGDLDLTDARPLTGAPLPPLTLSHCRVEGAINLRGAYMTRLELTSCELGDVIADRLHNEDAVIVTDARALDPRKPIKVTLQHDGSSLSFTLMGRSGLRGFERA